MWKSKFKDTVLTGTIYGQIIVLHKLIRLFGKLFTILYPTMWLHKMGIRESDRCSVCIELETTDHFFVTCKRVIKSRKHK